MDALWNGIGHYIFALWFLLLSTFFFYSSPNLSRHRLAVCHTCTDGVALVRIQDAGLKRAAHGSLKYRMQKIVKNSPSRHHRTTLSSYIFAIKAHSNNWKKVVKQQYLPHMCLQYGELGPLAAEISSLVWGTPANFNRFRVLAALLHDTLHCVSKKTSHLYNLL